VRQIDRQVGDERDVRPLHGIMFPAHATGRQTCSTKWEASISGESVAVGGGGDVPDDRLRPILDEHLRSWNGRGGDRPDNCRGESGRNRRDGKFA
jgi:hypothetical protein